MKKIKNKFWKIFDVQEVQEVHLFSFNDSKKVSI